MEHRFTYTEHQTQNNCNQDMTLQTFQQLQVGNG